VSSIASKATLLQFVCFLCLQYGYVVFLSYSAAVCISIRFHFIQNISHMCFLLGVAENSQPDTRKIMRNGQGLMIRYSYYGLKRERGLLKGFAATIRHAHDLHENAGAPLKVSLLFLHRPVRDPRLPRPHQGHVEDSP
jgi:hypothetical protein